MSDEWGERGGETAAAPDGPTAGALLRQAREAAGLHVAALAVALKVPVRKLEALEEDRFDLMPDNVFVRGLASSVCRTLKIDPQPILERLPQTAAPRLVRDNEGINTPFRAPSDGAPPQWHAQLTRPVFLAVAALLLGALVLVLLPIGQLDEILSGSRVEPTPAPGAVALGTAPEPTPVAAAIAVAPPTPNPASATLTPSPMTLKPAPALAAAPSAAVAPVVPPAAAPSQGSAVAESPAAPASGTVVFRAKGASWVEVTDAKGVVALRKVLAAGEAAGASGALPLRVTVGRMDMTDVQVRGKPFNLAPHLKADNVARFEVR